jgi:hypothetical protein
MAHMHLKVLEVFEDVDPTTRQNRVRVKVQEVRPRTITMNLTRANASQLQALIALQGGDGMIPVREGMMNGSTFFSLLDDEIIPINPPPKLEVSRVVEVSPAAEMPVKNEKPTAAAGAR